MARLARFLRSVLPVDLMQLIFLLGIVCLLVSFHLRWNVWAVALPGRPEIPLTSVYAALYPVLFASFAGYYFCFWAVRRPVVKTLLFVIAPAMASLGGVIYLFYQAAGPAQSVLASQSSAMMIWRWIVTNVANFTPGLQLCFVGILLCLLFLSRLVFGLTSLPLAAVAREPIDESLGFWRNCKALIFFLIGPVCQLWALLWVPMFFLPAGPLPDSKNALRLSVALNLLTGVALTLTPVLFFGKKAWNLIKRMLLLTEPRSVFFGLLVPIVISCSVSGAQFLTARAEWAHQAVRGIPPEFRSFFVLTWLNFHQFNRLVTGAFAEEIVFRGVLLALMTKRYGLHRGVFFTGIIWAAYHFPTDSYPPMSIKLAAIHVAFRILGCLAMNYVLAWMTMRWNSVIPSGFAHTVANVLIIAGVNPADFAWPLQIACWSVVAYVLWCYWPITEYDVPVGDVTPSEMLTNPQPAA